MRQFELTCFGTRPGEGNPALVLLDDSRDDADALIDELVRASREQAGGAGPADDPLRNLTGLRRALPPGCPARVVPMPVEADAARNGIDIIGGPIA